MSGVFRFDPKILIIGSTKHNGDVDSYAWEDSSIRNLDLTLYRTFLINFHTIPTNSLDQDNTSTTNLYSKVFDKVTPIGAINKEIILNLDFINKHLRFRKASNEASVILLINPKNKFTDSLFNHQILIQEDFCLTNNIKFKKLPDDRIGSQGQFVSLYFDMTNSQLLDLKKDESISMINPSDVVKKYFDIYDNFDFVIESINRTTPLAHTFYNAILACILTVEDIDFYILPHPSLVAPFDVVETIIRKIFEIQDIDNLIKPKWLDKYNTERQDMIKNEINELGQQIQFLKQQIKEKEIEYEIHQQFQRILYTTGGLLVTSVQKIFETMGFKVVTLEEQDPHDIELRTELGIVIGQVYDLRSNLLDRTPFRNLNQWVENKEEEIEFAQKVKGVLILAHEIGKDPLEKTLPEIEEPALNYAKRNNYAIITIEQLFKAYMAISDQNKLERNEFIRLLFDNSGYIEDERLNMEKV